MKKIIFLLYMLILSISYSVEVKIFEERKTDEAYNEMVKRFETENPDIKIKRVHYEIKNIREEVIKAVAEGNPPALIFEPADSAGFYKERGVIKEIENVKYFPKNMKERFINNGVEQLTYNGKLYGIPQTIGNHLSLIYNKNIVKKVPETWQEMISGNYGTKYSVVFSSEEGFWLLGIFRGYGGKLFNDKNEINLNSESMVKTLGFYQYLKFVKEAIPKKCDYNTAEELFLNGESAFIINGDWAFEKYRIKFGDNLGIGKVPKLPGGSYFKPLTGVYGMYFTNGVSEEVEKAAAKYVEFITRKEMQIYTSLKNSTLPVNSEALNSNEIKKDKILSGSAEQVKEGVVMPSDSRMEYIWKAIDINLIKLMNGEESPAEAAEEMQKYVENNYKK